MIIVPLPADYTELIAVWERSVRATHHFVSEADIRYYKPLIREQYFPALQLFGYRDAGGLRGFGGVDGDKLEMLFIDPAVRGCGIGKKLLLHAIFACQVKKVDVNEQNEQAVGFYRHMGFQTVSRSPLDAAGKPYPILSMELTEKQAAPRKQD